MGKRILSILLAAVLLISWDGSSLHALGDIKGQQALQEPGQENVPEGDNENSEVPGGEEPEKPGDLEEPGGNGQEPERPGEGEPENPEIPEQPGEDQEKEYTIYFNLAGGTTQDGKDSASMQVKEGELPDAAAVEAPVKKGYFFSGWVNGNGVYYTFDQPITGNISLLAVWVPVTYRVQFDLNGGAGEEIPEQIFTYDREELLPSGAGKKSGYAFAGWKQENGTVLQGGSFAKNLADQQDAAVVLKAVWKVGRYKVRYDANGGSGTMKEEWFACGRSKLLYKNKYKRPGYTFQGWNTKKDGTGITDMEKQRVEFKGQEHGDTVVLFAKWKGNPYRVWYNGNGADSGFVSASSHIYGIPSPLNASRFKKRGYTFAGWNTQKDGDGKTYQSGAKITDLTTSYNGTVSLYVKWKPVKYNISYNLRGGKFSGSAKKIYSINSSTFELPAPKKKGYDFDGWYKDSHFKKRVTQIKQGSTGNKVFYAKWVKCTRSPKKNSGKITACKAVKTSKVKVTATVKYRVASDDDCYYLVYVHPLNNKPYRMAKKIHKKKSLSFSLNTKENQGYAVSMYGIAVKKKGKYKLISNTSYVKNPEKTARNKSKYKLGKTKKGMQFYNSIKEIYDCGAKNNFLNMPVSMVLKKGTAPYQYNGKTYYFNDLKAYREIISACNKKGINVTMQIMLDWTKGHTDLIAERARKSGKAPYYTWNVYNNSAREEMEAVFCYLGSVFGQKKCYVSNWILGNEINNPRQWNYSGSMSEGSYFTTYAYAFRSLYYAVRSQYSNARIFICTDNLWNVSVPGGYSTKHTIDSFHKYLNKLQTGLKWNLAYHAYSNPLTYTKFWEGFGITKNVHTPYITMKNLNVLTKYIKKHYGSSVRIILSEQGYSSTWGQANQAAAIAYSYFIAACNPMVDAFIIRSYYDHPVEVAQGLRMGIKGKEAFTAFKYMDTSKFEKYTKRYLKVIGKKSWKKIVPGYKKNRIYKMYSK